MKGNCWRIEVMFVRAMEIQYEREQCVKYWSQIEKELKS